MMEILLYISLFWAGTIFGSFFLLVADRSISSRYTNKYGLILLKRSQCEFCYTALSAHMLVPVFSYLAASGKCRHCASTLSIRYPAAEIISGIIALLLFISHGFTPTSVSLFFLINSTMYIVYADIRRMIIPDILLIVFALVILTSHLTDGFTITYLYGMFFLGGLFLVILFIFPGSFGGGDIKYATLIGLSAGFAQSIIILEVALISGSLFGITYALISGRGLKIHIPFAPFLTIGLYVSLLWGEEILLFYHSLF